MPAVPCTVKSRDSCWKPTCGTETRRQWGRLMRSSVSRLTVGLSDRRGLGTREVHYRPPPPPPSIQIWKDLEGWRFLLTLSARSLQSIHDSFKLRAFVMRRGKPEVGRGGPSGSRRTSRPTGKNKTKQPFDRRGVRQGEAPRSGNVI